MKIKKKSNLRRGFKKEANEYTKEFRQELGLRSHDPLCPWALAEYLAIPILPLTQIRSDIGERNYLYVTQKDPKFFSGVTVFRGSRRIIIHNDTHHPYRQASDIAHELGHGILLHPPSESFDQNGCRNFNRVLEEEANWLGPTLLVSEEAALHIVREGMSEEQASHLYKATKEVVRMRINVTGAKKRVNKQINWRTNY